MDKIFKYLDRLIKNIIVISLVAMLIIMLLQVFYRFVLNHALPWPEEAIVILMLWSMYLSAAYLFKENGHIAFDYFVDGLSTKIKNVLKLINNLLIIIFLGIIIFYGFKMSIGVLHIKTGALRISRMIPYLFVPVSAIFMLIYSIQKINHVISKKQNI